MTSTRSFLTLALAASLTLVGANADAKKNCQPIYASIGPMTYGPACVYQGLPFEYCITAQVRGTLNGNYRFYGPANNWVDVPQDPPGLPGFQGMLAGWALEAFETKQGVLYTQSAWTFHVGMYQFPQPGLINAANSLITGGTGRFAGATGFLGEIVNESKGTIVYGEVCTP